MNKPISIIIAIVLAVGMMPLPAFAEAGDDIAKESFPITSTPLITTQDDPLQDDPPSAPVVAKIGNTEYTSLQAAVDAGGTIDIQSDVALTDVLLIGKSVDIHGNGHKIENTANRVIRITDAGLNVNIDHWDIISTCTATSDVRGISFDGASSNTSLTLDSCMVSASFYAINVIVGPSNLNITIKNGTVAAGWAAINSYSNNSTFTIQNSTLRGLNDKGEGNWNNFNTITFDGNALWDSGNIGKYGSGNTVSISGSTIYASSENSNRQEWLGIQYGASNNVVTVDAATRLIDDENEDQTEGFTLYWYAGYDSTNRSWTYYSGRNQVTIWKSEDEFILCTGFTLDGTTPLPTDVQLPTASIASTDNPDAYSFIGWKADDETETLTASGGTYTMPAAYGYIDFTKTLVKKPSTTGTRGNVSIATGASSSKTVPISYYAEDAASDGNTVQPGQIDGSKLVNAAIEDLGLEDDEKATISSVDILLDLAVEKEEGETATRVVYEVHPFATVLVYENGALKHIGIETVENDQLASGARFNVKLAVPSGIAKGFANAVHRFSESDETKTEDLGRLSIGADGTITVPLTHFSEVEIQGADIAVVASGSGSGGGTSSASYYATVGEAAAHATSGQTIRIPEGEFALASGATVASGVTLQGEGSDKTTLTIANLNQIANAKAVDLSLKIGNPPSTDPSVVRQQILGSVGTGYTVTYDPATGTYAISKIKYTIEFVDHNGNVLQSSEVEYGETPAYSGTPNPPVRPDDMVATGYEFIGWTPSIVPASEDATYKATFSSGTPRTYTVAFNNYDGQPLQTRQYAYGAMPAYTGSVPQKPADAQHAYVFNGWTSGSTPVAGIAPVTGDATYTAVFEQVPRNFTATFVDWDGTVLYRHDYASGAEPSYVGDTPTRSADSQYTYEFSGWSPAISRIASNVTYTAQYRTTPVEYTVTFKNWDGSTLQTSKVAYGEVPAYEEAASPARAATDTTIYVFTGWAPTIARVTGDATYTAQFKETPRYSKVVFRNWDGTVLQTLDRVEFGTVPAYSGTNPTKAADEKGSYAFSGWTPTVTAVEGADQTYTATFDTTSKKYTVTFLDDDGSVLQTSEVEYGTAPGDSSFKEPAPSKAPTAEYTYTFAGWTPKVEAVTKDATYKATYTATTRKYAVTFLDDNGSVLQASEVEYGKVPSAATPSKASTAEYAYAFAGWSPDVAAVTGPATYKATYIASKRTYTVTFLNDDGSVLQSSEVAYGATPVYQGKTGDGRGGTPTKAPTAGYTYTFIGWSPSVTAVTRNATYTARYEAVPATTPLYRLYNQVTGEHLYTADENEYKTLGADPVWNAEGEQGRVPLLKSAVPKSPVWRLFNPLSGEHHYTADANEVLVLSREQGWKGEGVMCYVPTEGADFGSAMYRLNNPGLAPFAHLFTTDSNEVRVLMGSDTGWQDEGIAWHCLK